ncbi:hypothetical protein CHUAL_011798 [Chamberlinius hualienensis]
MAESSQPAKSVVMAKEWPSHSSNLEDEAYNYADTANNYSRFFRFTPIASALNRIEDMNVARMKDLEEQEQKDVAELFKIKSACPIIIGYTTMYTTLLLRDSISFLLQNKLVDCVVLTPYELEHDLVLSLRVTEEQQLRDFLSQKVHHMANLTRATPSLTWTTSDIVHEFGRYVEDDKSIVGWAFKNKFPIICPKLQDMLIEHITPEDYNCFVMDNLGDLGNLKRMASSVTELGLIVMGDNHIKEYILKCTEDATLSTKVHKVFIESKEYFREREPLDSTQAKMFGDPSMIFPIFVKDLFIRALPFEAVLAEP